MPKIGETGKSGPKIEVIHSDYLEWAKDYVKKRKYNFIFADPPFNIGQAYEGYSDDKDPAEFRLWLWKVVAHLQQQSKGVIALHGPDDLAEQYLSIARANSMRRIAWINWHYRFGQCNRSNWIDARCHCLIYAEGPITWNPEAVLVESDRASTYGDKRVNDTERGGKRLPFTVWGDDIDADGDLWNVDPLETARRVPGFDGTVEACADGSLLRDGELLVQTLHSSGYLRVRIGDHKYGVHQLVCRAFHGLAPKGLVCRHLNGIPTDNKPWNLKWGTHKENAQDRIEHGRQYHPPVGEDHPRSKLTAGQVDQIRLEYDTGNYTMRSLSERFNVSVSQICRIIRGRSNGSVWGVPNDPGFGRVQGNNKERRANHPNQLPEVYLARLIRAYTNRGDWVLDPFGGSGTTAVVAQALGRNCTTLDISEANCDSIRERLKRGTVNV